MRNQDLELFPWMKKLFLRGMNEIILASGIVWP